MHGGGLMVPFHGLPCTPHLSFNSTSRARGEQFFLGGLAQQSLNVGEGVGKLDFGEVSLTSTLGMSNRH